ncbi:lytic murein transglycosylase [Mesorhizobium sp. M0047]|uniref:lytic murein transglycosylase n=1 Tax=Mesorhizobium sp. M0047 TaxID=2956859 RepID=UPI00333A231F
MKTVSKKWNAVASSLVFAVAALLSVAVVPAAASSGGQGAFVSELWSEAKARGIPRDVFDDALGNFELSPRIMELTKEQPETVSTVKDYVEKRVSAQRIETGRIRLAEWVAELGRIEKAYGVPAEVIVSIWGIETNYGGFVGGSNVVQALATLTHEGYRGKYFRGELMTALEILRDGHVRPEQMVGSWAGAMGQTQFMPSSFVTYAVDFSGDGRADIWNTIPDALASSANYLKQNGWRHGEAWGYEVKLPADFDYAKAWTLDRTSLREWQRIGVERADGKRFPRSADPARFFLPAGATGPAFLLLRNFDVIKRYNNSDSYALSVAHLADQIAGGQPFLSEWPTGVLPLSASERRELQALLVERGFDVGEIDGRIGQLTRQAIARFQRQQNMRPDAFPTRRLLQQLRASAQNALFVE